MPQNDFWKYTLLVVVAGALLVHALFPRYEWVSHRDTDSVTIVVYDRWTGRFQRALYDEKGGLNVMGVFRPF